MNVEEYLSHFFKGTKDPSLDAMQYFMEEFNHPEKDLKVIHIAGTNGKGSCAEIMSKILINAGYRVGKFMSPHLVKYNERISIQNKNITDDEMEKLIIKIKPKIDKYNQEHETKITLFELEATMAILYFYESNCDYVVMETGLGGLYDCTNIVTPIVSIITSVGFDHMNILGNTLIEIATQKAGIIKENSETIFVEQDETDVNELIKRICSDRNNKLHLIKKDYISNYSYNKAFQKIDYKELKDVVIKLKGKKQIYNASICIECTQILRNKGADISEENLRDGLMSVVHKGRFEVISKYPQIVFDGAHNKPAIENFTKSVQMYYGDLEKRYIISILKTKDYETILKDLLQDEKSTFIFTDGNDKDIYTSKEVLLDIAKKYTTNKNLYIQDLDEAIDSVKDEYKNDVTFLVGSFYTYGTVMEKLEDKIND